MHCVAVQTVLECFRCVEPCSCWGWKVVAVPRCGKGVEEHLSCSLCIVPLLSCGCTAAFQRINCSLN